MSWRSSDSLNPQSVDWMLDEHRSRSRANSTALDACIFRRYKLESIGLIDGLEAILRPSTSEGIMRISAPSPRLGIGNLEMWSFSRSPARWILLDRVSSSITARGDISPPYSLTSRWKESLLPSNGNDLGFPFRVRNRWSLSHPCTTRSEGMRVARPGSELAVVRFSIRLISFLGKPVIAATFE